MYVLNKYIQINNNVTTYLVNKYNFNTVQCLLAILKWPTL